MEDFPRIDDLAAIGDGRTTALIGPRGGVELMCLPRLDEQIVLGRLLDRSAGAFDLQALGLPDVTRRYLRDSNVLQTRWRSGRAEAVVTDGLIGGPGGEAASTSLVRRIRCVRGPVTMRFLLTPRFGDGLTLPQALAETAGGIRIEGEGLTLAFGGADAETREDGSLAGEFELSTGESRTLTFGVGNEPIDPAAAAEFLDATTRSWRAWTAALSYEGRWRDAVVRSMLALRMLIRDTSGAIAAAGSLDLPEADGGERNYDYRYCWLRDASFVIDALASAGARESARRYLDWLGRALRTTAPVVQPFYRLDGDTDAPEREADLAGYRGARPVRIGNRAFKQLQLGSCGDLLQSCALMHAHEIEFPWGLPEGIVAAVNHLMGIWREPDSGIWEIEPRRQHTWSKMACWIAFMRAAELSEAGVIDGQPQHWRTVADEVHELIETQHFDPDRNAYVGIAGEDGLDAAVLLGVFMGYRPVSVDRWHGTLQAIADELAVGPRVYRTSDLRGQEATFLPCAFWRAHALVRLDRLDEARELLDELIAGSGPFGLLSEEADEDGGAWGNIPQALTHAALINACVTYEQRAAARSHAARAQRS
jgi:GH15 family glucan-1,4-alpha-glucosidase